MADALELATAYVSLVPSMKGAESAITKELMPGASAAADVAGKAAGGKFSGSMTKVLAGGAVVGGIVAGFKGLYEVGSVFDDVSDTIRVGTGKSGDALDALTKSAENIGKTVPASFEQVGTTVADVNTRMGLTGGTLEKVASQYLEAGRMLGQDIDIGTTSAAFSAFKITGDGVAGAMDTLFQVSQSTGVGMNELAASVQKNAPAMQTLGFSFEETAALAGSLDKAGLNSTAMMSSMGKGMVTLAKAGENPQTAFKRVTGEIGAFVKAGDKASAIKLAAKIFGTKGASQFVGALESGSIAMDDLVAGAKLSGDTILGTGAETQDFAEKWQLVQNKATAALAPLGSAVFTWLGDTLTALMPTLELVANWFSDNTWAFGVVAGIIGGVLVAAFIAWTASIWAATVALLANPVTWIVIAIIALIAALVLLAMNWDAVAAWISGVWGGLMNWLGEVFGGLGNWLVEIWNGFVSWIMGSLAAFGAWASATWSALWAWVGSIFAGFGSWLSSIWAGISAWFMGALSAFGAWIGAIWAGIVALAMSWWNNLLAFIAQIPGWIMGYLSFLASLPGIVGGWIGGMVSVAIGKFGELLGFVAGIPGQILGFLGNVGSLLWNAGSQIMSGLLDGIRAGFGGIQDFVGGIGQWIADHKGPKAYDLKLLVPAGGWIMGGFVDSLKSHIPDLEKLMGDVTSTLQVGTPDSLKVPAIASPAPAGGYAAASPTGARETNITVNNPVPEPAGASITTTLAKVAYLGIDGGE